jgi:signal transduction histidine kinase
MPSIKVELKRKDDTIVLLISDNGIGFTNLKKKESVYRI